MRTLRRESAERRKSCGPDGEFKKFKDLQLSVRTIMDVWNVVKDRNLSDYSRSERFYEHDTPRMVERLVKFVSYSAADVEAFSRELVNLQDAPDFSWKSGDLINALVKYGKDSEYVIHTSQLTKMPAYLRSCKGKTLIICGDAAQIGEDMEAGTLVVNGNALAVGFMKGGIVHVKGNIGEIRHRGGLVIADDHVKCIRAEGNAEVQLNGACDRIDSKAPVKIYHEGTRMELEKPEKFSLGRFISESRDTVEAMRKLPNFSMFVIGLYSMVAVSAPFVLSAMGIKHVAEEGLDAIRKARRDN